MNYNIFTLESLPLWKLETIYPRKENTTIREYRLYVAERLMEARRLQQSILDYESVYRNKYIELYSMNDISLLTHGNVLTGNRTLLCYYLICKDTDYTDVSLNEYLNSLSINEMLTAIVNGIQDWSIFNEKLYSKITNIDYITKHPLLKDKLAISNSLVTGYCKFLLDVTRVEDFLSIVSEMDTKTQERLYNISFNYPYKEPIRRYMFKSPDNIIKIFSVDNIQNYSSIQLDFLVKTVSDISTFGDNIIYEIIAENKEHFLQETIMPITSPE